jgi:hypothetical protein
MNNFFSQSNKTLSSAYNSVVSNVSNSYQSATSFLSNKNPLSYIIAAVLFIIMVLIILYLSENIIQAFSSSKLKKILDGTTIGNVPRTIYQDPSHENSITLERSKNEDGGMEFSYSFWIYLDDWSYKYGTEKLVFNKGENASSMENIINQCPRVTLDKTENKMHFYFNTFKNMQETFSVDNLPLKKWICVSIVVVQHTARLFVNGFLKKTHVFSSLPKQNYRDVQVCKYGGFSGYISNLYYYSYAITPNVIEKYLRSGPSSKVITDETDATLNKIPPYFSAKWWN